MKAAGSKPVRAAATRVAAGTLTTAALCLAFSGTAFGSIARGSLWEGDGTTPRARIIDDNSFSGNVLNIGATDFTIEWWMKGSEKNNPLSQPPCQSPTADRDGGTIIDRSRMGQGREFAVSVAGGFVEFQAKANSQFFMACGTDNVLDEKWHHVAIEFDRTNGFLWIFVDGILNVRANGPFGDISYPIWDGPNSPDDAYLGLGGSMHTGIASYHGLICEIRISDGLRYQSTFTVSRVPFSADDHTVGLFHLNEGAGSVAHNASSRNGPDASTPGSSGTPQWSSESPFQDTPAVAPTPKVIVSTGPSHPALALGAVARLPVPVVPADQHAKSSAVPTAHAHEKVVAPKTFRARGFLESQRPFSPLMFSLLGLGMAIAIASRLLRENRL